jgi:hypothetical protein
MKLLGLLCSVTLISCACGIVDDKSAAAPPAGGSQSQNQEKPTGWPQMTEPVASDSPEGIKKAWKEFTSDGRYRMIRPDEFSFSQAAKKEVNRNVEYYRYFTERPFIYNIFHPGGYSSDLVVIVVDTTRDDASRFALVIFNSPKYENENYELHWLFREKDLSKVFMDGSRIGLNIHIYDDDGSQDSCIVKWDEGRQEYSCGDWRRFTN